MLPPRELVSKLRRRIDRRVHVSPQPFLCLRQRADDGGEVDLADDEQVDVASRAQLAPRGRAKDEGDQPPVHEGRKRLAEDVGQPRRLGEDAQKLREDRSGAIRLEIHLSASHRPLQESRGSQLMEFPLHRAKSRAGQSCDLAKVVRLVGVPQQQGKHPAARASEQHRGRIRPTVQAGASRPHVEYRTYSNWEQPSTAGGQRREAHDSSDRGAEIRRQVCLKPRITPSRPPPAGAAGCPASSSGYRASRG